jgi:HSP20 family protein
MFALSTYRRPAVSLPSLVDELLNDGFWRWPSRDLTSWSPTVDIVESKDAYTLHAELPGLEKKDINVSVEDGVLTVSGERKFESKDDKDDNYRHYERRYGSFTRSFKLPEHVDANRIKASHKNGVLELSIPKTEAARPRQIEVKVD